MDVWGGLDLPIWILFAPICLLLSYLYFTQTFNTFKKMGVPYIKPLPVFGSLLSLPTGSVAEVDIKLLKTFPGRMHGLFHGRQPVFQTSDYNIVKQIAITNFSKCPNRSLSLDLTDEPILKHNLTVLHGDHWKHVRSAVTPIFSSGKLKQMFLTIVGCCDQLVTHLKSTEGKPIQIKDYTSGFATDVIASTAFGLDLDAQSTTTHPFVQHAGTMFGIPREETYWTQLKIRYMDYLMAIFPNSFFKLLFSLTGFSFFDHESLNYFRDLTNRILSDEKAAVQKQNNFVTMCANKLIDTATLPVEDVKKSSNNASWSPKGLTHDEIVAQAAVFLFAGYETTATTLQFFFYAMAFHPEIQEQLYQEIAQHGDKEITYEQINELSYLDWCVKETLRMYPPALKVDRETTEDFKINGMTFPKNMKLCICVYAIHHDPEYWPEPERFLPERFSPESRTSEQQYTWLPFGLGNRNCIGMRLALLEVKLAVYKMIKEFRFEKTESTVPPEKMKFRYGFAIAACQPVESIQLVAVPRSADNQKHHI